MQPERILRPTVFARLLLILVAVSALPTSIVTLVQGRVLARDLESAAAQRLARAQGAAERLLEAHREGTLARYRAISGTPQLRATLEVGDEATLLYYAGELARREGALAIAFVSEDGRLVAGGPEPALAERAWREGSRELFAEGGRLFASSEVPLQTGDRALGALLAVEPVSAQRLEEWSETCGADLRLRGASEARGPSGSQDLERVVKAVPGGEIVISTSLAAERLALAHARRNLALVGLLALAVAVFASVLLSRSWVRPIEQMQRAAERIGEGEFGVRIGSARRDEIGDVARAFDAMGARLATFRDEVGAQRRALEAKVNELNRSEEGLRNAQRLARMGSWRCDLAERRVELSAELANLLRFPPGAGGEPVALKELVALVHPDDRETLVEAGRLCVAERSSLHVDHRVQLPDGSERILSTQARFAAAGVLEGTAQDITERRRIEDQVRYLAQHDALTGLGNRQRFTEQLERELADARRSPRAVGVLFLDLDRFKRINDTLGHSVGDRLLQGVADRLLAALHELGGAGGREPATLVSRFGGDEFTVLVPRVASTRALGSVAHRLLAQLTRPFLLEGHEIVISASIGIAASPADGSDAEVLMRNADAAMNHAKTEGRNNVQFYTTTLNEEGLQRLILESNLRQALARGEFEVHYQPKLDAQGCRVLGFEALVRWNAPGVGLVPPGEFIHIAEEIGLIGEIGDWVLRRSCEDRVRWNREGRDPVPVAVNLSAHQFRDGNLAERVTRVLDEVGLPPEQLELEITESTLLHDEHTVVEALRQLRSRGVRVALDDFGTGYSSLAYLSRLPVDSLKVDRSFVADISGGESQAALAAAIVAMGRALRLRVVAEGVETEGQRARLEAWGCDELQGYLLARPMPAARMLAWWREHDAGSAEPA